ncbi:MAG: GT4 family glycosyltransferase PelF, partial [Planctomycetota bacterium]
QGWEVLVEAYRHEAADESFLNFFWTWRYAYLPLFNLLSCKVPEAKLYHTICTGYAGLLAATAKIRTGRPMLLTEHGIYLKERRIEINRATWIRDWESDEVAAERQLPYFKQFWIQQFATMSQICYQNADEILTLHQGNAEEQMREGGDPRRIRIVANGIDLHKYQAAAQRLAQRAAGAPFTVGFVGRVTPIKDVKTLLSAVRLVADQVSDLRVRIMGGMEEDPSYAEECKQFMFALHLEDIVKFEGRVDVIRELPTIDVVVLTSISESQPLAILEAGAVGLPFVATNVGSCAELAGGRTPADRQVGIGGLITPIAAPGATARALLKLHRNPALRRRMGRTMQERVRRFYDESTMVDEYRELYGKYVRAPVALDAEPAAPASRG